MSRLLTLACLLVAIVSVAGCAAPGASSVGAATAVWGVLGAGPSGSPAATTPAATPTSAPTPVPSRTPTPTPAPTPRARPAATGPIVALGDSITYGYGVGVTSAFDGPAPAHSYPWDMARDLGIPVVNAGISGTTAAEVLDPASESEPRPVSLQLPALLALHPRLMVVGFGTNEANRGWPIARTVADLRELLSKIAAAGVPIVLVGTHVDCRTMPCSWPEDPPLVPGVYTTAWDAALRSLATEFHAGLVLDVEQGLAAAGDMTDWIHPDARGYQIIADRVEVAVRWRLGVG